MERITSKLLNERGVVHGFGLRGCTLDDYLRDLNIKGAKSFLTDQMHGDNIIRLTRGTSYKARGAPLKADAFITNELGMVCLVRTADCVPILMYDPKKKVVAAVHSGWRGTDLKIAAKVVDRFVSDFGSRPKDICVSIGPSISGKCYEFGEAGNKYFVDLQEKNRSALAGAGVKDIEIIPICSHCDERFASYRRDKTEKGRQINFIIL